jgi:hypothetical protein
MIRRKPFSSRLMKAAQHAHPSAVQTQRGRGTRSPPKQAALPESVQAREMLKDWEAQQTDHPAWDSHYLHTPPIVVLEVCPREPRPEDSATRRPIVVDEPKHWILVERHLTFKRGEHGEIDRAAIELRYTRIGGRHGDSQAEAKGSMSAGFSRHLNAISLAKSRIDGTTGAVFLSMQGGIPTGWRIGTYLMNEIVTWAKHWPEADVQHIALVPGQAVDDRDRDIRNRFWERFGLKLQFDDSEKRGGRSLPMKAKDLTPSAAWEKNITRKPLLEFARALQSSHTTMRWELETLAENQERFKNDLQRARKRPFLWAWGVFYEARIKPLLVPVAVAAVLLCIVYINAKRLGWWA